MRITENYVFFWKNTFSQWHPSVFQINEITYKNAEQYMMAEKARLFKDYESEEKILLTNSPKECKRLGRLVKNFDLNIWNSFAKDIVYNGNKAKFTQNQNFYDELMQTGDKILAEASPYDKLWGIGLSEEDDRCLDPSLWQGKNWLGEVLTKLRNDLKNA